MSKPIRVLHILQRMEAGGTQALLMNLYRNIDRSKVQFDFLVEYPDKQFYDDEIEQLGGKVYYTSVRIDFNIFKFQKQVEKVIKENNYKIVHVHAYTIGYFALKTAKKCKVPIRIAHSHNNAAVKDIKYLPKLIMQKLYTIYATDLFACSEEAGKYFFKNKKYKVLNNAIDSNKFIFDNSIRINKRKQLKIEDNFVVGHIGRFHPQKNHEFLLKTFVEIKKIKTNAKLILIGSGPLENKINKWIDEYNIKDDVIILNNRSDINEILMAMDIFVFPSLFEGLGIVAIESQAAGTPIIMSEGVSTEACITDICKRKSLECSNSDWAKEAIKQAERKDIHMNMQKYVINAGFDFETTINTLTSFYIDKSKE